MPAALSKAGFDVSLFAPANSLVAKSRFVDRVQELPQNATPLQWVVGFAAIVNTASPDLIVPADDDAVRLMQTLVLSPPHFLPPAHYSKLAGLIRESLGDPDHYRTSVDKTLLPVAAEALGVRTPPFVVATELAEAQSFAAAQGYPVVIKRGFGAAGEWVAIVPDRDRLAQNFSRFKTARTLDLEGSGSSRLLVQAHISGKVVDHSMVAWRGSRLAGFTREKLVKNPPMGPSTVDRVLHAPEVRSFSDRLATGLGMNGFFAVEYIMDHATGESYLLEINRRVTSGITMGAMIGVDLCAAMNAALTGNPSSIRTDVEPLEEHFIAHFPEEWLRDPQSRYLREYRIDAPWDDLGLLQATLAMRHGK